MGRQLKGSAKAQWGKLTDADLTQIEGRREQLEGKIQEYGYTKERVRKELDDYSQGPEGKRPGFIESD